MIQTEERTIGETTYRVTMLGAVQGRKLLTRLFSVAGPVLGEVVKALDAPERKKGAALSLGDVDVARLGPVFEKLAEHLTEAEFDHLCDVLSPTTAIVQEGGAKVVGLKGIFDVHFAGRYGELFKWLAFALEVNYRDFFSAFAAGGPLSAIVKG